MKKKMPYKGKEVVIEQQGDNATIRVDDMAFECMLHHGPLDMWHCREAYFSSPDIHEMARHFVDYLYIFKDPNTAPPIQAEPAHGDHGLEEGSGHGATGHSHDHGGTEEAKTGAAKRKGKER